MPFQLRLTSGDAELLRSLLAGSVDVTLIGGKAMIFYGMPRQTFDTDLALDLRVRAAEVATLLDTLARLG